MRPRPPGGLAGLPCWRAMTTYRLEPDERTVHRVFSRDLPPVLTVDSGDTVVLRTLDAGGLLEPPSAPGVQGRRIERRDRKSTRLNSSHLGISYAVFCLKKKKARHHLKTHITEIT